MTLNEYQAAAAETAIYPDQRTAMGLLYVVLKLNGEAGEVAECVGKAMRDEALVVMDELLDERREQLVKEAGDVLWYLAQLATELNMTLEELAEQNIRKLADRAMRGRLRGSGNTR